MENFSPEIRNTSSDVDMTIEKSIIRFKPSYLQITLSSGWGAMIRMFVVSLTNNRFVFDRDYCLSQFLQEFEQFFLMYNHPRMDFSIFSPFL